MPTLNWIGKEKVINHHQDVPYRVLEHKYGFTAESGQQPEDTNSGNLILHGDNLEALKSLLPKYESKVKCIYIDPPYNTGNEGWAYNDNVSDPKIRKWLETTLKAKENGKDAPIGIDDLARHDKWLCMIYPRIKLLSKLLTKDGAIFISIDDNECHTLKLLLDEIFGPSCFIADIIWKKRDGAPNDRIIGYIHEHILIYAKAKGLGSKKTIAEESFNLIPRSDKSNVEYKIFEEPNGPDPRGPFRKIDTTANGKGGRFVQSLFYPLVNPYTLEEVWPRQGTCWRHNSVEMERLQQEHRLYWGINGKSKTPMRKLYLFEARQGMTVPSIWMDVAYNQHGSNELEKIFGEKAFFDTPKPVDLISRIIHIGSEKDSIVLDSFAGSGTTAHAVFNQNQLDGGSRKFILVEMEDYAETITAERVKRVINGYSDKQGTGGGFDYYELGNPLFVGDNNEFLNEEVETEKIREYVWYSETRTAYEKPDAVNENPYFLGLKEETAYYFIYEKESQTTLDFDTLSTITTKAGQYVVYADNCLLPKDFMMKQNIIFKKIPRDVTRF